MKNRVLHLQNFPNACKLNKRTTKPKQCVNT